MLTVPKGNGFVETATEFVVGEQHGGGGTSSRPGGGRGGPSARPGLRDSLEHKPGVTVVELPLAREFATASVHLIRARPAPATGRSRCRCRARCASSYATPPTFAPSSGSGSSRSTARRRSTCASMTPRCPWSHTSAICSSCSRARQRCARRVSWRRRRARSRPTASSRCTAPAAGHRGGAARVGGGRADWRGAASGAAWWCVTLAQVYGGGVRDVGRGERHGGAHRPSVRRRLLHG